MHNLRRVAAGLRGEYLEPEATPEPEDEQMDDAAVGKKGKMDKRKRDNWPAAEEWQDKDAYEREEGVMEIGELGDRTNVVQDGGEEPEVEVAEGAKKRRKDDGADGEAGGKMDKEARKKAKKERNEQRKREDAAKKAGNA